MKSLTRVWKPGKPSNFPFWKESSVAIWGSQDGVGPAFTLMPLHGCHSQTCQRSLWMPPACPPQGLGSCHPRHLGYQLLPILLGPGQVQEVFCLRTNQPKFQSYAPCPSAPTLGHLTPPRAVELAGHLPGPAPFQPAPGLPASQKPRKQGIRSAALPTLHVSRPPTPLSVPRPTRQSRVLAVPWHLPLRPSLYSLLTGPLSPGNARLCSARGLGGPSIIFLIYSPTSPRPPPQGCSALQMQK